MKVIKPWTFKEIRSLTEFRKRGKTVKECARILGRTVGSVKLRLHRTRLVVQPKSDGAVESAVAGLVKRGRSDAQISTELGLPTYSVRYRRRKLGLAVNRVGGWANGRRVRCWGCNTLCPFPSGHGWEKRAGWSSVPFLIRASSHARENYCPACVARYGLPTPVKGYTSPATLLNRET